MNVKKEIQEMVKARISVLINDGLINKDEIFTLIIQEFNIPRPTVRRIARDYRNELIDYVRILQSQAPVLKEDNDETNR